MRIVGICFATLLLLALPATADNCDYTAQREAVVDAAGATRVTIDVGAGFLKVEGRDGLTEVVADGTACASDEDLLEDIRLEATRQGNTVRIVADMPESRMFDNAALDLRLEVPANVEVRIDDGSGYVDVRHVGALDLDDGSGEIEIIDVQGNVTIDDGSGEIYVEQVAGDVEIDDGSGEIEVRKVTGSVTVEDGSGEIDIAGVDTDVVIEDDGSGSIEVRDVGGDFIVRHDGSGHVRHRDVAGQVRVPRDH